MELYVISYCRLFNQHGRILFPQFVFYVQNKTHLEEVHAVPADLCSEYFSDDRKHLYFSWCARAKWNGFTSTRLCYCHSIYFLHFKKDTKKRPLPLRGSAKFHHIYTSSNYNIILFPNIEKCGILWDAAFLYYFAYSTARVSRMTVTLICPG